MDIVIYFAGDALICVFRETEESLRTVKKKRFTKLKPFERNAVEDTTDKVDKALQMCIVRALKCSIALRSYEANELTTHIALSCGRMYFATLGGFQGHWSYLLNGPCIAELCSCLTDASPKQVVMTARCNDLIRNTIGTLVASFATTEMSSGNFILDNIAISVMFVPPWEQDKESPELQ